MYSPYFFFSTSFPTTPSHLHGGFGMSVPFRQSAGSQSIDEEGGQQSLPNHDNRLEYRGKVFRGKLCVCFPSTAVPHSVASYSIPQTLSLSLENTKREPYSLNSGVSPGSSARKLIRKTGYSKMNKAVAMKTNLNAEFVTCSFSFPRVGVSQRVSQGVAPGRLGEWREIPVGKTGSLCFATRSEGPSFGGKKSESIQSRSCRKLKTVPVAFPHF